MLWWSWGLGRNWGFSLLRSSSWFLKAYTGGTAKRTEEMGYKKLKPCPGCESLQRPVVSPLGGWGAYCSHPCLYYVSRPWLWPGSSSGSRMFKSEGWMEVWAECREGKCAYTLNCKIERSSIRRMLGSRTTSAWCLLWPGDSQEVMDSGRWGNSQGASLQGQYGLMRETFYS